MQLLFSLKTIVILFLLVCRQSDLKAQLKIRERINLQGGWGFKIDPLGTGVKDRWMDSTFTEKIELPGSMAEHQKGEKLKQPVSSHLSALWQYQGAAWYQHKIEIPSSWSAKAVHLSLERSKVTSVWFDSVLIGKSSLLSTPQSFQISADLLKPGWHTITICVNNDPKLVSVGGSHALSEHTQTNWNGILGKIYAEATSRQHIKQMRVRTDFRKKRLHVELALADVQNLSETAGISLAINSLSDTLAYYKYGKERIRKLIQNRTDSVVSIDVPLDTNIVFWDEYHPRLYLVSATLYDGGNMKDIIKIATGFREFKAVATQFQINDKKTFLRGKNESCVFPLTGYPPTDVAQWRKLYQVARQYGINHFRFHSYTPPEAAFEAADIEGFYLQAELPNWADFTKSDSFHIKYQYKEGKAILDAYGNHPSFVMFSLGNELAGDEDIPRRLVRDLRNYDGNRRLFAFGTNAFYNDPHPGTGDDFWVTMRTGRETSDGYYDVRGSFATTEDRGNGILNRQPPNTTRNFSSATDSFKLPIISHEVGQYQIYPDYSEIPQYTGVLKPLNFEIFKSRLIKAGMENQADSFFKASGLLATQLYRREIEMALGTPGLSGFQLLDIQDFPGQGTALVGILNAFMRSKGLIKPDQFRQSCNDLTIQLLMEKFVWTNAELFTAAIQLVNYSPNELSGKTVHWEVVDNDHNIVDKGIKKIICSDDAVLNIGKVSFSLSGIKNAECLKINLGIEGTDCKNEYPVWVYPSSVPIELPASVTITSRLTDSTLEKLYDGNNILLFPDHECIVSKSVKGQFISEFWNWKVFKDAADRQKRPQSGGTLGILTNPGHPLFRYFPTSFYSSWQWWTVLKNSRPLILDKTPEDYRPLVQVIDNIDRNHKLGLVFEFRVGKGKILVCMSRLDLMGQDPASRQLYYSMLQYMVSPDFNPATNIGLEQLKELL